jgi:hypothetical protein
MRYYPRCLNWLCSLQNAVSKPTAHIPSQLRDRQQHLKGALLLAWWLACPVVAWVQEKNGIAPGVKVLATLEGSASAWSPDGQRLAYVARDGIWVVEASEFRQPRRLLRMGWCAGGGWTGQLQWSPDGQQLTFTGSRPGDEWGTIWLTDAAGSRVQDLLPPQLSEIFGSAGVRGVGIDTWLSPRELAFSQYLGGGGVAFHKVDVESRQYWSICAATMEGGWYWAPTKDRLILPGSPPGTAGSKNALIVVDGRHVVPAAVTGPPDCQGIVSLPFECGMELDHTGQWYAFDAWAPDGKRALLTGYDCPESPPGPAREFGGDLYL